MLPARPRGGGRCPTRRPGDCEIQPTIIVCANEPVFRQPREETLPYCQKGSLRLRRHSRRYRCRFKACKIDSFIDHQRFHRNRRWVFSVPLLLDSSYISTSTHVPQYASRDRSACSWRERQGRPNQHHPWTLRFRGRLGRHRRGLSWMEADCSALYRQRY